jgi:hypothetical protein
MSAHAVCNPGSAPSSRFLPVELYPRIVWLWPFTISRRLTLTNLCSSFAIQSSCFQSGIEFKVCSPRQSIRLQDLARPPDSANLGGDAGRRHFRGRSLLSSGPRLRVDIITKDWVICLPAILRESNESTCGSAAIDTACSNIWW